MREKSTFEELDKEKYHFLLFFPRFRRIRKKRAVKKQAEPRVRYMMEMNWFFEPKKFEVDITKYFEVPKRYTL